MAKNRNARVVETEQSWTIGIDLGDKWSRYCIIDETVSW
jgi:hypothetical protein